MKRIVVYEFVSGGGLADSDPAVQAELLPLGKSMRDAMLADLLAVPDVRVSAADCAAAPLAVPGVRNWRARPGQSPFDFIAELAAAHDLAWIVAPESGGLLAQCQALVGETRWLGCGADAIRMASSKSLTLRALHAAGVATPLDFEADAGTRRWVVKPDDGAGAVATHTFESLHEARAAAERRRATGEAVTLEPWVEGPAMSVSLWIDDSQGLDLTLLSANTQDIRVDPEGRVQYAGVALGTVDVTEARGAALTAFARACVGALPGLRGFAGIDFVWHAERGPVAIEVNPRVSCAYVGQSARLGRNLAADLLALHARRHPLTRRAGDPHALA